MTRGPDALTVLTALAPEPVEAEALVGVQRGFAQAAVVAGLLGARVVLEHGHAAGAQGVLLPEDGGPHEDDLEAGNTGLKGRYRGLKVSWLSLKYSVVGEEFPAWRINVHEACVTKTRY